MNPLAISYWNDSVGISSGFLWLLVPVAILFGSVWPAAMVLNFAGRKAIADLEARVGPNRTGLKGFLQPLSDVVKLLGKVGRERFDGKEFRFFVAIAFSVFCSLAIMPIAGFLTLIETPYSSWILICLYLITTLFFNWYLLIYSDRYTLGQVIRQSIVSISALIPVFLSLLSVSTAHGGLGWSDHLGHQGFWPNQWSVFSSPFLFISAILFWVAGLALIRAKPFQQSEFRTEVQGTPFRKMGGLTLLQFRAISFYQKFTLSIATVTLFYGGYHALPLQRFLAQIFGGDEHNYLAAEVFVSGAKAVLLLLFTEIVSEILPQVRTDRIVRFIWTVLSPVAVMAWIGQVIWMWVFR